MTKEGKLLPVNVAVGDRVLLPEYGGHTVKLGEDEYRAAGGGARAPRAPRPAPRANSPPRPAPPRPRRADLYRDEDILGKFA